MQLSTTTSAIFVVPSPSTRQRACSGSWAEVAFLSARLPLTEMGKCVGVMSWANAPAESFGSALAEPTHAKSTTIAANRFMVDSRLAATRRRARSYFQDSDTRPLRGDGGTTR